MTLKSYTAELSEKAKAFSVENLLSVKNGEERVLGEKLKKTLRINSKLQMRNGITAELCGNVLWEKFNRLGTEMIVTRAGRRMFPTLKFRLHGLKLTENYIIYLDINLAGETRYRYNFQRCEWTPAGPSNNQISNSIYVHPSSPARGEDWMSREISFDKVKLTNNRKPSMKDQVSLHSMHKYQPTIHVLELPSRIPHLSQDELLPFIWENSQKSEIFIFEQTAFVTVTAYQNQEITNLKIQSNPFAKGFREMSNSKRENRGEESSVGSVCPVDRNFE